jgi:hypothetical protein
MALGEIISHTDLCFVNTLRVQIKYKSIRRNCKMHSHILKYLSILLIVTSIGSSINAMQLLRKALTVAKISTSRKIPHRQLHDLDQKERMEEYSKCINRNSNCACAQKPFHDIVAAGNFETTKKVIEKCAKREIWRRRDRNGSFPIHHAKDEATAELLLKKAPDLVNARNYAYQRPRNTCPPSLWPLLQAYGARIRMDAKNDA